MGLVALWHVGSSRTRDWTRVPRTDRCILPAEPPGKSLHCFNLIYFILRVQNIFYFFYFLDIHIYLNIMDFLLICSPVSFVFIIFYFLIQIYLFYLEVNYFTILYWFCYTSTWIHHRYTRAPCPWYSIVYYKGQNPFPLLKK